MKYKDKIEECTKRVYNCDYSQKPKCTKKLEKIIDRNIKKSSPDMNEDVDYLILISVNYLGLPPYVADRTKLIMAKMWVYPDNFHDLKYENVILGVLMYVTYEDPNEETTVDFRKYCTYMFGAAQAERNIRQMYEAYDIVRDLYQEVEGECGK